MIFVGFIESCLWLADYIQYNEGGKICTPSLHPASDCFISAQKYLSLVQLIQVQPSPAHLSSAHSTPTQPSSAQFSSWHPAQPISSGRSRPFELHSQSLDSAFPFVAFPSLMVADAINIVGALMIGFKLTFARALVLLVALGYSITKYDS